MNEQTYELIERYLNEVRRHLPPKSRDDVVAELRSLLGDKLDDRVEGTPTEADISAMLTDFGSPREVAASYGGQRYLIGPALYPLFETVLQWVVFAMLLAQVVAVVVQLALGSPMENGFVEWMAGTIAGIIGAMVTGAGWVVLIFAILERREVQLDVDNEWSPDDLPELDTGPKVDRLGLIIGIIFNTIFIGVLTIFEQQVILFINFEPGPAMTIPALIRWGLIIAMSAEILLSVAVLWMNRWTISAQLVEVVINIASLGLVYMLYQAFELWRVGYPWDPAELGTAVGMLSLVFFGVMIGLGVGLIVTVARLARSLFQSMTVVHLQGQSG